MTSTKFVKSIVKDVADALKTAENNSVNREFKSIDTVEMVRIDAYYNDIDAVIQDEPTIRTTFNSILADKKEKLNTIKHLERYLKELKSKIQKEEDD